MKRHDFEFHAEAFAKEDTASSFGLAFRRLAERLRSNTAKCELGLVLRELLIKAYIGVCKWQHVNFALLGLFACRG